MAALTIDLQEGFAGDTVILRVNGREVSHQQGVSTDLSASLAASVEVPQAGDTARVEVTVPTRQLSKTITVETAVPTYLGLSLAGGEIRAHVSRERFYYM